MTAEVKKRFTKAKNIFRLFNGMRIAVRKIWALRYHFVINMKSAAVFISDTPTLAALYLAPWAYGKPGTGASSQHRFAGKMVSLSSPQFESPLLLGS